MEEETKTKQEKEEDTRREEERPKREETCLVTPHAGSRLFSH